LFFLFAQRKIGSMRTGVIFSFANDRLNDLILGRVADLEEPDSVEVVEGQKELGYYVR
jgi:hypothetical protein